MNLKQPNAITGVSGRGGKTGTGGIYGLSTGGLEVYSRPAWQGTGMGYREDWRYIHAQHNSLHQRHPFCLLYKIYNFFCQHGSNKKNLNKTEIIAKQKPVLCGTEKKNSPCDSIVSIELGFRIFSKYSAFLCFLIFLNGSYD